MVLPFVSERARKTLDMVLMHCAVQKHGKLLINVTRLQTSSRKNVSLHENNLTVRDGKC